MNRTPISLTAMVGVLALGITGGLAVAPSAGAASLNAGVKPGSTWTLNTATCTVVSFAKHHKFTDDAGDAGTWKKPIYTSNVNMTFISGPNTAATYKGTYSKMSGDYSGKFTTPDMVSTVTMTPGATGGC